MKKEDEPPELVSLDPTSSDAAHFKEIPWIYKTCKSPDSKEGNNWLHMCEPCHNKLIVNNSSGTWQDDPWKWTVSSEEKGGEK